MAIPEYCVVGQLPHVEDVYLVTRKLSLPEDYVLALKYTGSSFLYPEPYYNVTLEAYLSLRQPDAHVLSLILASILDISKQYRIQPKNMLAEGITFNHNDNRFVYPKQLISFVQRSDSKDGLGRTPFNVIEAYIDKNKGRQAMREEDQIVKLQEIKDTMQESISTNGRKNGDSIKEKRGKEVQEGQKKVKKYEREEEEEEEEEDHDERRNASSGCGSVKKLIQEDDDCQGSQTPELQDNNDKDEKSNQLSVSKPPSPSLIDAQYLQKQFLITDQASLSKIIDSQRQTYEQSVVFSFLQSKQEIHPHTPYDKQLLELFNYATLYKKIGQHKLAKTLYAYFQRLLEGVLEKQKEMFEREEPKIVNVKLDLTAMINWVTALRKDLQEDKDDGLIIFGIEQHSAEWFRQRKTHVTASNFGNISKANTIEKLNRAAMEQLFPKFFGNEATRYGTDTEAEARDKYIALKKDLGYTVKEFGLMVDKRFPWIAGSPDGIVFQNGKKVGCLEIKCPFSVRDRSITDSIKDIVFLERCRESSRVQLKKSHAYYSQCQGIMRLSGVTWCDFFVYTKVDCLVIRVEYDEEFMKRLIGQLNHYYFGHLLVEILMPCQSIHIEQQVLHKDVLEILEENEYDFEKIKKKNRDDNPHDDDTDKEEEDGDDDIVSNGTESLNEEEGDIPDDSNKNNNHQGNSNNNNATQELDEDSHEMDLGLDDNDPKESPAKSQQLDTNHNRIPPSDASIAQSPNRIRDEEEENKEKYRLEEEKENKGEEDDDSGDTQPLDELPSDQNDDATQPL